MRARGSSSAVVLLTGFLLSVPARAQTTGDIRGTVSDPAGNPLPGATIEATSPRLQGTRVTTTSPDGTYRIPAVPPGPYKLTATLAGMTPDEKTATIALDATATADFTLRPSVQAAVLVSSEASPLDMTSTTTGTSYTSRVVERLPVARNYADIVRASPGVNTDQGDTQGRSLALAVYGATSAENLWLIDGVNTTNVLKGIQGKAINNEFVEEVEVKSGGFQAEYGGVMGGVVNVITKSGGNDFHGDAFVYYDSFQTRVSQPVTGEDSVVSAMRITDYRRSDYGLDLGGFILKDCLWFFGAYNRVRIPAKVSRSQSSEFVSDTLQFPLDTTDNLYSGKLTWRPGPATTVVGTVFADPTENSGAGFADPRQRGQFQIRPIVSPDPATWEASRFIGGTDYALRLEQLFGPTALLTLQASHHEDRYELTPTGPGEGVRIEDFTCEGGTPESPCQKPQPDSPNAVAGGLGIVGLLNQSSSRRDQARADLSLFAGNHELKLGTDFRQARTQAISSFSGSQMVRRFNDYGTVYYRHDFFARSPTDFTPVDVVKEPRTKGAGAYLQDTWNGAPGWTVSAGLRWDQEDIRDYGDRTILKTTAEWQPRLGVAWDPGRDGRTKIYAFAGRFYYAIPTDLSVQAYGAETDVSTFNFDPASLVQDPAVPHHATAQVFGGAQAEPADAGIKGIYQDEFTFGFERLIAPGFTVGLKATYRRLGRAIEDRCDLDSSTPESLGNQCGLMNPGSDGRIARGDLPGCNGLNEDSYACTPAIPPTPPARRLYRGIEILARKTVANRFWLQASYVFSSLRGNYDGEVSQVLGGQTAPGINGDFDYPALLHNGYGRLYLDRPHALRLDGFFVTPFKLSVGLNAYVRSGAPLNRQGYFNQWYGAVVQLDEKGTAGRLPTEWEASLVLAYPIAIGPVVATLQAFVFNLFNNQIRTSQNTDWTTQPPADYPASLYDPSQPRNNPEYGKVTSRQEPRLFRAAVKVSF